MSRSIVDGLLVVLALGALAFGAVLATVPTALPSDVLETVAALERAVEPDRALLAIALVVGLFALWRSYFSGARDVQDERIARASDRSLSASPEGESEGTNTVDVVGERTSEQVEETISSLRRGDAAETDAVREALRTTLGHVEATRGHSSAAIDDRIRRGEWTDDRIAAVFLGDETAGTLSIRHRLRRWLFPARTFERRLERTLAELERYAAVPEGDAAARAAGEHGEGNGDETLVEETNGDTTVVDEADGDEMIGEETDRTATDGTDSIENTEGNRA